jgi:hypothetical protein
MAILATTLSVFKENKLRTHRETKKSYYVKLQGKQVYPARKRNKTSKIVNLLKLESEEGHSSLIFSSVTSIFNDDQLSPEQFDRVAHNSMLEMLSINRNYYYQFSKCNESA